MLIIPFDRKIDWTRPPVATLLLIIINILLYFGWQSGDDHRMQDAVDYYRQSGLAMMEHSAYADLLTQQAKPLPAGYKKSITGKGEKKRVSSSWIYWALSSNRFSLAVENNRLIPTDSTNHQSWRDKRDRFEHLMSKVVFWQYGLKTNVFDPFELFSHMFLHGSFMHLFGNMFFLMAVGYLVERTFGSGAYLACYLLAGLGGAAFDFIFSPDRLTPGIGASGAVSGLMGMYAVLFWTRRIRFFYFLFVIFGFATLPAIILLPLWIANELIQLFSNPDSNINYLAHLGGLVSGGTIALLVRNYLPSFSLQDFEKEDRDTDFEQQLDQALELCDALEYRKAKPILSQLYSRRPDDDRILHHLHQCSRLYPEGQEYHRLTHKILSTPRQDHDANQWVLTTYRDYLLRAKPGPKLNRSLILQLANRFIETEQLKEAERLVVHLLKKAGSSKKVRYLATKLGETMVQAGDLARGRKLIAHVKKLKE